MPLAAACLLAPAAAMARPLHSLSGPWVPRPGEYFSEIRGSHGSTSSYFDANGEEQPFPYGTLGESREAITYNEFGWKGPIGIVLAVPLRSVTYRDDLGQSGTQTGLSDLLIGFKFRLLSGESALAVEAVWQTPLGYYNEHQPPLGAGVQNLGGRVTFGSGIPAINGFFELGWGYAYRSELQLDRMVHNANLGVWAGNAVLISAQYSGSNFVGSSEVETREDDVFAAGPEIRYRLDDRMDVFVGSFHTVAGRNVNRTDEYFIGFAFKRTALDRLQGYLGGKRRP